MTNRVILTKLTRSKQRFSHAPLRRLGSGRFTWRAVTLTSRWAVDIKNRRWFWPRSDIQSSRESDCPWFTSREWGPENSQMVIGIPAEERLGVREKVESGTLQKFIRSTILWTTWIESNYRFASHSLAGPFDQFFRTNSNNPSSHHEYFYAHFFKLRHALTSFSYVFPMNPLFKNFQCVKGDAEPWQEKISNTGPPLFAKDWSYFHKADNKMDVPGIRFWTFCTSPVVYKMYGRFYGNYFWGEARW